MKRTARLYNCVRCHCQVTICTTCDRGNIYCAKCAQVARKKSVRAAGKRYQATRRGRMKHAERQRRYRERRKKVTHQGIHEDTNNSNSSSQGATSVYRCHFCKRRVSTTLRSGFLRGSSCGQRAFTGALPQGP